MNMQRAGWASAAMALVLIGPAFALERRELLPETATITVRISSTKGFLTAADHAPLGRLWRDPGMQAFMGNPPTGEALLRRILVDSEPADEIEKEIGELEYQMIKMVSGEIVLGFDPSAENDQEPWLLATLSRADYERSLVMDRRIVELNPAERTMTRSKFMGQDLYAYTRTCDDDEAGGEDPDADVAGGAPEKRVVRSWQCHVGQTVVNGTDEAWVKACVARLLKETPTEPAGDPELLVHVDVPKLLAKAAKEEAETRAEMIESLGQSNPDAVAMMRDQPTLSGMLQALGLGNVGALDARIILKPDACRIDVVLPIGEQRTGVLTLLDTAPCPTALRVPFVSEQTVSYSVGRGNLLALWKAIPGMVAQVVPPSQQAQVNMQIAQLATVLGVDPEADLLAHLGTLYVSASSLTGEGVAQVFGFGLRNEPAFRASLDKVFAEGGPIHGMLGSRLSRERVGDHTVYLIGQAAAGEMGSEAGVAGERQALAVGGGFGFFGAERAVRDALQSLGVAPERAGAFYAGPLFRRLERVTPPGAIGYEITDLARLIRTGLSKLTEDEGMMGMMLNQMREKLDMAEALAPDKLPPASHIASFLGPVVSTSELRGGRFCLRMEGFYPGTK